MLVAGYQLTGINAVGIDQVLQELFWHGAVIDKAAHRPNLALLDLLLHRFHNLLRVGRIGNKDIGIA